MSKTIQKTKTKNSKPYDTVNIHDTLQRSEVPAIKDGQHRTYIVRERLRDDKGNLWGVIAEANGEKHRIDVEKTIDMIKIEKVPFVVDWTGKDKPATLIVGHRRTADGIVYYLKTIGDKYMKNNFNNVPEAKAQSSSFRLIHRIR